MPPPTPLEQALECNYAEEANQILKALPARAERILRLRFGLGVDEEHTLDEIGAEFGLTRERIRQIEIDALQKLRNSDKLKIVQSVL